MTERLRNLICLTVLMFSASVASSDAQPAPTWPSELVEFVPDQRNPLFTAGPPGAWDSQLVERAWILKDGDVFKMYYSGYVPGQDTKLMRVRRMLGYATSPEGIAWKRHPRNPIQKDVWIRDPCVVKHDGTYFLFAEMERGAHWFTSPNGIVWDRQGSIIIRDSTGRRLKDPAGVNPTAYVDEEGVWHLYFQHTGGIWGAKSEGPDNWVLIADRALIKPTPGTSDGALIAPDQVIRHDDRLYMYYQGRGDLDDPRRPWSAHVATSEDGVQWVKYPKNPVVSGGRSAFLVDDGNVKRLYATHGSVRLFWPKGSEPVLPPAPDPEAQD